MNNILLTGATGFVGKVVLYDLLTRKNELSIGKIYLPIRGKASRTAESRFKNEIAKSELFNAVYKDWVTDVIPISGELSLKNCDFSDEDYSFLNENITHIIHCAASVDFNLPIEEASKANIDSALNVLEFAKNCKNLKKMVAVSTAYVTPHRNGKIPEELYQLPFDAEKVYEDIKLGIASENLLMQQTGHPNTYTLTKCISEHILFNRKENVPLCIVRPSIVSATVENPYPGWIDSASTIAAFVVLQSVGHCKVVYSCKDVKVDIVPCDIVSKHIIKETFSIYNGFNVRYAIGGISNAPKQSEISEIFYEYFSKYKHGKKINNFQHYIGDDFIFYDFIKNKLHLKALGLLSKKSSEKLNKLQSFMDKINDLFEYFTTHTYDFESKHNDIELNYNHYDYIRILTEGVSRRILKYNPKKVSLSGKSYKNPELSDFLWALTNHNDKFAIKVGAFILRKNLPKINSSITFDLESFYTAVEKIGNKNIVIVPNHRSYLDFLLCSYLFYAYPEIGIKVPYIAAAEDFSKIPFIGSFFKSMKAFYIKRGTGKEDPELTKKINELVKEKENIQFFIEGTRSRTRRYLNPKTGILRCLQNTKKDFVVLPMSITYDKLPEENSLMAELSTGSKGQMNMMDLLSWYKTANSDVISLGKVHIKCGSPIDLSCQSDIKMTAKKIVGELQKNSVISTYHLRSFLKHSGCSITLERLKNLLIERGAEILESDLQEESDCFNEICLRQQWIHYFYNDAFHYYKDNEILKFEKNQNLWFDLKNVNQVAEKEFIDCLFNSFLHDTNMVFNELNKRFYTKQNDLTKCLIIVHPIHTNIVYDYLVSNNVICFNKKTSLYEKK